MYRVEHKEYGCGPYNRTNGLPRIINVLNRKKQPVPKSYFDFLPNADFCIFGFKTRKELKMWFSPYHRKILSRNGYVVRHYKLLPRAVAYKDRHQIAIDRRKIKAVLANPISLMEI